MLVLTLLAGCFTGSTATAEPAALPEITVHVDVGAEQCAALNNDPRLVHCRMARRLPRPDDPNPTECWCELAPK